MNNGKHGQGTHCTKIGTDSLTENAKFSAKTVLMAKFIIYLPKPKMSGSIILGRYMYCHDRVD